MDNKEYIASGILELYVAGVLTEQENQQVYDVIQKSPEALQEVESIEKAILQLTAATSVVDIPSFDAIKAHLNEDEDTTKVIPMKPKQSWTQFTGWVAAIILAGLFIWSMNENNQIKEELATEKENIQEQQKLIDSTETNLAETQKILDVIRDKNVISVPLAGQQVSPTSYAKVYWDKQTNEIYLDAKGLPKPPEGKVYQIWSLKLTPLTPTSLGTLESFADSKTKIFTIPNSNESEAFGITLEPKGGSESPTLEQLYTLGAVTP